MMNNELAHFSQWVTDRRDLLISVSSLLGMGQSFKNDLAFQPTRAILFESAHLVHTPILSRKSVIFCPDDSAAGGKMLMDIQYMHANSLTF
jgi:hypothetical protein